MTEYTYGQCEEKRKPGGCQLHNLHCGYPDCDRRAITGAQPAPAAPSGYKLVPVEPTPEMIAASYAVNAPYCDNSANAPTIKDYYCAMLAAAPAAPSADRAAQWLVEVRDQFRGIAEQANQALTRHVADLAQPADSAMEVLRELVACEDFKDEFRHITRGVYAPAAVQLADEYGRRVKAAIDRARTLSAASNKERQHG